jgi:hypothetical protein
MTETEPVTVWDVSDPTWTWRHGWRLESQWLRRQGLPVNQIYRAEFFLGDPPCVKIFCYALNEDGRMYLECHDPSRVHDHDKCGAATEPPRMVPLNSLPPRGLLDR